MELSYGWALDAARQNLYSAAMNRILILLVVTFLAATALFLNINSHTDTTNGEVPIGGDFNLMTHTGDQVTNESFRGKPRLVYFGFTHCPDICPTGLSTMEAALEELRGDAPVGLFITVAPERDTRESLGVYMQNFPKIIGLTGTPEQIKAVAQTYKIYYKKVENKESPEDYTVDHSSLIYLLDGDGKYLAHFPHTVTPLELAARIRRQLHE